MDPEHLEQSQGSRTGRAKILFIGRNLASEALAHVLRARGTLTKLVDPEDADASFAMDWQPDLVLIDNRVVDRLLRAIQLGLLRAQGVVVGIIGDANYQSTFETLVKARASVVIDANARLDDFLRTVSHLIDAVSRPHSDLTSSLSAAQPSAGRRRSDRPSVLAILTAREREILAELTDGHCAEEIANASSVSISTVRSQIKSILQKLGVNSQLAAVALARRTEWPLGRTGTETS